MPVIVQLPGGSRPVRWLAATLLLCLFVSPSLAVEPLPLAGKLAGVVTSNTGVPQMGAAVLLFNRNERLLSRGFTDDSGRFSFDSLLPDVYSLRVTLASFVPAIKKRISIQPGMSSFLAISLSSVISSVELIYISPGQNPLMSDDWKWALRSAPATRPVLRLLPGFDLPGRNKPATTASSVFSDTRGVFRLSAGEGSSWAAAGAQADLGTAFALATSVFGANHIEFSGNLGYAARSGAPTAGFRTSYSRGAGDGSSPELNLTVRQVFLPGHAGLALLTGRQRGMPDMKTLTLSSVDRRRISDSVQLDYGATLESVSFVERLNYLSPFARARWDGASLGEVVIGFSSGALPVELLESEDASAAELSQNLSALASLPRVSLRGRSARVQRTENIELGYRLAAGSRTYAVGAYRERVSNAAFTAASAAGFLSSGDLLPDLFSNSSIFNAGNYSRTGHTATFTQTLWEDFSASFGYAFEGGLTSSGLLPRAADADQIRASLARSWRHGIHLRFKGTLRPAGTRFTTSYQITDYSVFTPVHVSLTEGFLREPGFNMFLRQPIPTGSFFPVRLEASADLRNLLAQGYLPLSTPDGRRIVLIHSPRSVRGGLSFIF